MGIQGARILRLPMLEPGMPAEKAGIKVGDQMIALNGQPFFTLAEMIETLKHTKDQPINIDVLRDGQPLNLHGASGTGGPTEVGEKRYRVGFWQPADEGRRSRLWPQFASR